jgi:hypothetical protein
MYLVINNCVTAVTVSNFPGHYLRNISTLDRGVLGYIGMLYHKEHPPEVWQIPPETPCIYLLPTAIGLMPGGININSNTECAAVIQNIQNALLRSKTSSASESSIDG